MARSAAALLAETLDAHGVDLIYCVPGESYLAVTDALIERPHMRLIVCRHESGAAFMAVAADLTKFSEAWSVRASLNYLTAWRKLDEMPAYAAARA